MRIIIHFITDFSIRIILTYIRRDIRNLRQLQHVENMLQCFGDGGIIFLRFW